MRRLFNTARRDDLTRTSLADLPRPSSEQPASRHTLFRIVTSLLVVSVVVAFLTGVATNRLPNLTSTRASTTPVRGGSIIDDGYNFDQSLLPGFTANPAVQAIWAPLWYGDPQGILHPGLAAEVPSSTNGGISVDITTWTIHLRPGLKWSDGFPLTADDCAFTFHLFADLAQETYFPSTDPADPVGFVSAKALDTTTVLLQVRHPFIEMLGQLADSWSTCLPKEVFGTMTPAEVLESRENFWPTVVSGPFMVKEHVMNDHLTLVRNPYYYQGPEKPYLNQVKFVSVAGGADAQLRALQTHSVDTTFLLDYSKLASYRAIPGYTTSLTSSSYEFELLVFNLTDPILSDHAVRQAITMSIDRNKIIQSALNGTASLTCDDDVGTFAHEATLTCYRFDPSGAERLLDTDGWTLGTDGYRHKNGQMLELQYATTYGNDYGISIGLGLIRAATQPLIRDDLKTIGMKIDLKVFAPGDLWGNGSNGAGGALSLGSYQIAEFANYNLNYEPPRLHVLCVNAHP